MRNSWLFDGLDDHELRKLTDVAVYRCVDDGHVLFRRGDATPGLHLVESGVVKIYSITPEGEERILSLIGPGEFCGEMGIVDGAPSSAWGQALGRTCFWEVPAMAFERLMLSQPAICLKVCRVLVARVRQAGRQLDETLFLSSRQRVLCQLMRLAEQLGIPEHDGGVRVGVRLTHQEIALLAGTSRETVTRVLSDLTERGLLMTPDRQLVLADLQAIRLLAGAGQP